MAKPNVYVLGGTPELILETIDRDGNAFQPTQARISVKDPTGLITVYSGGDMIPSSGYYSVYYRPPVIGWYEYEGWARDNASHEQAQTNGFEVVDRLY